MCRAGVYRVAAFAAGGAANTKRGLAPSAVPVPVSYSPRYSGESVRGFSMASIASGAYFSYSYFS